MNNSTNGIYEKRQLPTAGLVVIKDRKLLLAFSNNKKAFYLPGGKIDPNENTRDALVREIQEELNIQLSPQQLQFYTHITAQAFGESNGLIMEQDCFIAELPAPPVPSAEIGALDWFTAKTYKDQPQQVPGVIKILAQLHADGLID